MMRDGIHTVFPGQFYCGLPHRIRQLLPPRLGATNLIQLELYLRDCLRNDCAHAIRPRPLFGGSTKVTGRVSGRHACLPKRHRESEGVRNRPPGLSWFFSEARTTLPVADAALPYERAASPGSPSGKALEEKSLEIGRAR